jgi:hypothetical protein
MEGSSFVTANCVIAVGEDETEEIISPSGSKTERDDVIHVVEAKLSTVLANPRNKHPLGKGRHQKTVKTAPMKAEAVKEEPQDEFANLSTADLQRTYETFLSKNSLRRLVQDSNVFQCLKCPFCIDKLDDLRNHINKTKHRYGLDRLKQEKKTFFASLKTSRKDDSIMHKMKEFKDINCELYNTMTKSEKVWYMNILRLSILQVRILQS